MSTPNFPWLPVSALCTDTHVYNMHHRTKRGSNTSRALEGNSMPGAGRAAQFHHTAEYMPWFPVLSPEESRHLQQWQEQNYCRTRVVRTSYIWERCLICLAAFYQTATVHWTTEANPINPDGPKYTHISIPRILKSSLFLNPENKTYLLIRIYGCLYLCWEKAPQAPECSA